MMRSYRRALQARQEFLTNDEILTNVGDCPQRLGHARWTDKPALRRLQHHKRGDVTGASPVHSSRPISTFADTIVRNLLEN